MTTIAFCGLGAMGGPMAANLLQAGCELVVWNRSPERARELVEGGARQAASPAEAAKGAEAVITMLTDPAAVEDVVFGPEGAASGIARGTTLIEMSTIGPAAVHRLRERLPEGVGLLDAPVLGSIPQATEGTLKVFVGGDPEVFERWKPMLAHMGEPRHVGPLGSGAAMKVVVNSCLGFLMVGVGEALALADALGIPEEQALDVLAESPVGATIRSKRKNIESGEYPANFKLSLAAKDLGIVMEEAERAGVALALPPAVRERLDAAVAAGRGDSDYSVVIDEIRSTRGT